MSQIDKIFLLSSSKEEVAFKISGVMKNFIDDLDGIDYAFLNVDEERESPVFEQISDLLKQSLGVVAELFECLRTPINEDRFHDKVLRLLFPFLQNQFEVRLRLLETYWARMKDRTFATPNPDLAAMGAKIGPLTELIQEFGDGNLRELMDADKDDIAAKRRLIV